MSKWGLTLISRPSRFRLRVGGRAFTVSDASTAQDAAPSEDEETHSSADSTSLSGDTEDATGAPDVSAPSETACETSDDCATQDCWGVACVEGQCTYERATGGRGRERKIRSEEKNIDEE